MVLRTHEDHDEPNLTVDVSETSEDLAQGQFVIIAARWILIFVALLSALWAPDHGINTLRITIFVILALAVANFYLHAQLLMRRQALDTVVYTASIADLAVITAIIFAQDPFKSNIYIFYYPAILAFSVAFPMIMTLLFTGTAMVVYGFISVATATSDDTQTILIRLAMMAAVAFCGNLYLRIERDRRRSAVQAQQELMAQVRERVAGVQP